MSKKGIVFITIGVFCLASAAALFVFNKLRSDNAYAESTRIADIITEQISGGEDAELPTDNPDREMPEVFIEGRGYGGILEIPDLDLKLSVASDFDYDTLQSSPCIYSGSVYARNLVIAAHNYDMHFGRISSLSYGSRVIFTDAENHSYITEVIGVEVLRPEQVEELTEKTAESDWDLTLFTCNYSGSERITLRCKLDKIKIANNTPETPEQE